MADDRERALLRERHYGLVNKHHVGLGFGARLRLRFAKITAQNQDEEEKHAEGRNGMLQAAIDIRRFAMHNMLHQHAQPE